MAGQAQRLYELQVVDLEIDDRTRRLEQVEAALGESEALIASRAALQEVVDHLHGQAAVMRDLEWKSDDLESKIKEFEGKLYGGTVKSSKELGNIQREVDMLKTAKRHAEDQELDVMSDIEASQERRREREKELATLEGRWREEQAALQHEREELLKRGVDLRRSREAIAASIEPRHLVVYEKLRADRKGRAVATVEQNICQGCRITLPTTEVQRARTSADLVCCSSCGRILWASR